MPGLDEEDKEKMWICGFIATDIPQLNFFYHHVTLVYYLSCFHQTFSTRLYHSQSSSMFKHTHGFTSCFFSAFTLRIVVKTASIINDPINSLHWFLLSCQSDGEPAAGELHHCLRAAFNLNQQFVGASEPGLNGRAGHTLLMLTIYGCDEFPALWKTTQCLAKDQCTVVVCHC